MKMQFPLLLASLVIFQAAAPAQAKEVTDELHETYPLTSKGRVSIGNVNGAIRIRTWEKNEVKLDAVKRGKNRADLDEVKIIVQASENSVRIQTKYPTRRFGFFRNSNSTQVDYELRVPREALLDKVSAVNGSIEIEQVAGDLVADTVNGKIHASGLSGNARLSSVNGSVTASFDSLPAAHSVNATTVNGSVLLTMPGAVNADVDASTVNGGISTDFDMPVHRGTFVGRSLRGRLGEGGGKIKMSAVNGSLKLRKS